MTGSFGSGPGHCRCKVSSGSQISPNTMLGADLTNELREAAREEINEFNGLSFKLELLQVFFFSLKNTSLVLVRD